MHATAMTRSGRMNDELCAPHLAHRFQVEKYTKSLSYFDNGAIFRGASEGVVKHCIELKSQPVGMERINKNIYVGTMDQMLHCFTAKVGITFRDSVLFS